MTTPTIAERIERLLALNALRDEIHDLRDDVTKLVENLEP